MLKQPCSKLRQEVSMVLAAPYGLLGLALGCSDDNGNAHCFHCHGLDLGCLALCQHWGSQLAHFVPGLLWFSRTAATRHIPDK